MKKCLMSLLFVAIPLTLLFASGGSDDFMQGTPDIQSMGALAFGPDGVLFVADSQGGAIFAIDTGDKTAASETSKLEIENIDEKIADMLGTTVKDIRIHDLAVNPISQNAYLSLSRGQGDQAADLLLSISPAAEIREVSLQNVRYARKALRNPVSAEAESRRGQSLRVDAVTDLAYSSGQLFIAGLSNEEFSSALRVARFPFDETETMTSLEIFHAAHRQFETNSPIRTLVPYSIEDQSHVIAAYTCTPLVTFPVMEIKDGAHIKGKTVAELGSGNRPLDMIVYKNGDKEYILIANSNRTLMKIDPEDISKQEAITEPVTERYATSGLEYIAIAQVGVQQIDNLNEEYVLAIQRSGDGSLNLRSLAKSRL